MTLKKDMVLLDSRIARGLRVIVSLRDPFTGKTPIGDVRVSVSDPAVRVSKNLSGDYLFFRVHGDVLQLSVESDYYFAREIAITISGLPADYPVKILELQPKPCYPFPSRTTLIKGMVKDPQGNWAAGAVVTIDQATIQTLTTAGGEFVCYYTGLGEEDIVVNVEDGKRYLKGGEDGTIPLRVSYNSLSGGVDLTDVEEGEVTRVNVTLHSK